MKNNSLNFKIEIKKDKAITLMALVVTIIILLILAGVTIGFAVNGTGIFNKAKLAKDKYNNSVDKENDLLAKLQNMIGDNNVNSNRDGLEGGVLAAYPVGSIYLSTVDTNPGTIFGGTWVKYAEGKTLIGEGTNGSYTFNTTTEQTDENATTNPLGVYKHQLSVDEMPSHTHKVIPPDSGGSNGPKYLFNVTNSKYRNVSNTDFEMQSAGGDQSHNNIQPYVVTYMWQRVG